MASTINGTSTGSGGLITTGDDSGILNIQTNETTAITVDASQNVGVGTTSPSSRLDVQGTSAGGYIAQVLTNNSSTGYVQQALKIGASGANGSGGTFYAPTIFYKIGVTANDTTTPITFVNNNDTERARIDSSGNLLVGTTSNAALQNNNSLVIRSVGDTIQNHANGTASGSGYLFFGYNAGAIGSITQSGTTAVLYNTTSDQRLKENIQDADSASSLIDSLKVRQFDWKSDNSHQRYGFVAQELVTVAPEAVHQPSNEEDMMAVDYSKLVPMLVKEIQSLRQRITALEGAE